MKPYTNRNIMNEEWIFNYHLSMAHLVVVNTFGILAPLFWLAEQRDGYEAGNYTSGADT